MKPFILSTLFVVVALQAGFAAQPAAVAPGTTISFNLPQQSYVTIAVDDSRGNRVRNLVAEQLMPAGKQSVTWDGLDDYGQAVPLGVYHWKGLYRGPIHQVYQMSAYDGGARVPWFTTAVQKATDTGWLSDHNPTWSACAAGDKVFLGAITSENGQDMMAVDLTGHKLWGVSHPYGVGAMEYAYDGQTVFAAGEGQWGGANAYIWTINPTTFETKQIVHIPTFVGMRGMVVKAGLLYLSSELKQEVLVIDPATGKTVREIALPNAGGLAETKDGTIYAITGTSVVELTDNGPGRKLISDHLTRPNRMAIGPDGMIYITDGPTSWYPSASTEQNALYGYETERFKGDNQVKVFDSTGKFVHAIGTPGGRHSGPWDPQAMRLPVGITVDSNNHIWVAEWDLLPKRISVWNPDGTLFKEFIGAHKYGGGGSLDPADERTLIYDGNMMTLDWANAPKDPVRSWKFDGTLDETMPDTGPKPLPVTMHPTRMVHYQGHSYLIGASGWSEGEGGLFFKWDGKRAVPCAYIGPSPVIPPGHYLYERLVQCVGTDPPGAGAQDPGNHATPTEWGFCTFLMTWSDVNGDGKMDPGEVTFTRQPFHWLQDTVFGADLSAYIRNPAHRRVTSVWKIPMSGINANGSPVWDVNQISTVVNREPNATTGGGYAVADTGRVIIEGDPICGIDPTAHTTWTYKNDWPDEGAGAPKQKPGVVIAGYGMRGIATAGGETGNVVAISSDFGQWYLFTADGLFLSTIFGDTRTSPLWVTHFPEAKYGMLVDGASLGQESFSGSLNAGSDGAVYAVCGHPHLSVVKLTGFDTVHRMAGELNVTAAALDKAESPTRDAALADRKANGEPKLKFWTDGRWEGAPFHPVFATTVGGGANLYTVFPHYSPTDLYLGAVVDHFASDQPGNNPLRHGDTLVADISHENDPHFGTHVGVAYARVVVTYVGGKGHITVYQYTGPGHGRLVATKDVTDGDVKVETIKLDMGPVTHVSARIPWADINATPPDQDGPNDSIRGDMGIVVADPYGGPSKLYMFADKFLTIDTGSAMDIDPALFGRLTRQAKGE